MKNIENYKPANCIENINKKCIDRRPIDAKGNIYCCLNEVLDEISSVLYLLDHIDDTIKNPSLLKSFSTYLSFTIHTIHKNKEKDLEELFPMYHHFSVVVYEQYEEIIIQPNATELITSYLGVIKNWFCTYFINIESNCYRKTPNKESIVSDFFTIKQFLQIDNESYNNEDIFFN